MKCVYLEYFHLQIHQNTYCFLTEAEPQELMINTLVLNNYERGAGSFWISQ